MWQEEGHCASGGDQVHAEGFPSSEVIVLESCKFLITSLGETFSSLFTCSYFV